MILRDTYKKVHLLGHREHPAHRSICGMVDARWPWAGPHLTNDPTKTNCGLCLRIRREREINMSKPEPCSVCAGTGTPTSGLPCVCGGKGTLLEELAGLRNVLYAAQLEAEAYQVLIRGLLEILDSPHIRHCEALASVHGHSLDKETSERYGDTIKQARALLDSKPESES